MSESVRYGAFTVRTECSHCGNPLPLHGPLLSVVCPSCLREARIPEAIWQPILEAFDERHEALADGEGAVSSITEEALPVRHEHKKRVPACEKCASPFAVAQLPVGADQDFSCIRCGDPASTHPAPEWLQRAVPTARQFYSTEPGAGRARTGAVPLDAEAAIKPVVMACPSCGASLSATSKSERIMACQYCRADVYLPDEVWRRLHPVPTVTEWFIRFEGKTRRELEAEERAAREAEKRSHEEVARLANAERARKAKLETDAQRAARDLRLHRQMRRMIYVAYVASYLFVLDLAVAGLVSFLGFRGALPLQASEWAMASYGLLGGAGVLLLVALVLVGRPIKTATSYDGGWMLFCTWFWVPFSLFMPIIGQIMALVRAFILFRGSFGSTSITTNEVSTRTYPAVVLTRGEARPAAILFLALALLYPLCMLSVFAPDALAALLAGDTTILEVS